VTSLAALCQRLANDLAYQRGRTTTNANQRGRTTTNANQRGRRTTNANQVMELDTSVSLMRDYMRCRPLSPVDLTEDDVPVREESV